VIASAGALFAWYEKHGRSRVAGGDKPRDPYHIVVSEFMLQQTQVDRVLPLYEAFVAAFPSFAALAEAEVGDVIRAWRGLGYNSRAVRLRDLARVVMQQHAGALPQSRDALLALPGIGPYTAAAVRAFAFDYDDAALDTNIRRIVHRVTLGIEYPPLASGRELDTIAAASVPPNRGHDWNSAMMDLGSMVCTSRAPKCLLCPLRQTCVSSPVDIAKLATLAKQFAVRSPQESIPFERTTRFLRGRIIDRLRDVPAREAVTMSALVSDLTLIIPGDRLHEIPSVIQALIDDGIVSASERGVTLRSD
jgi:A/G-specific adenine glycosylase